ncbi:MAG: ATP-binding protein [Muribaculaceae bacterium]
MKRKVYNQLLEWKRNRRGKVAVLIEGARRIGKSYIAEAFGRAEYKSYLLIDFGRVGKGVKELFEHYLDDIDTLLTMLELYGKKKLYARTEKDTEAQTLIIFDEVQFCPRARSAIKYLVADGRYDYIETGSLVSIKKNVKDILLPSEEHTIEMYPMDFEEFLWALGEEQLMPFVAKQFEALKPMGLLHRRAMDYLRQYMIVGGMPQAVKAYVEKQGLDEVDDVKRDILSIYRNDIRKYADNQEMKVSAIFEEIPGQLQKHERKFRLSDLESNARMRNYAGAFFWLEDARIVNCCYNSTEPSIGLRLKEERTTLKCYMCDTGLLISHAFDDRAIEKEDLYRKLMLDKLEVNAGMLMENMVAQMLRAAGHKLFFFSRYSVDNAEDRMEIDFLIAKSKITSRHNISAIEVKSGSNYTISSLNKCLAKYANQMATPYVVHTQDLKVENGIVYLPIYMAGLL